MKAEETSKSACILFLETVERRVAKHGFIVYSDALLLLKLVLKLREQRNIADDLDTADTFDAELDELVERDILQHQNDDVTLIRSALAALNEDQNLPAAKDGPFAYMDSAIEELCKKSEGEK